MGTTVLSKCNIAISGNETFYRTEYFIWTASDPTPSTGRRDEDD